jgi:anti-sigma-K factor RskA
VSDDTARGHAPPDLVGLITGEVGRDDTIGMGQHLRTCQSCTGELIDLVVAHGALISAARADQELVAPSGRPDDDRTTTGEVVPLAPEFECRERALPPLILPSVHDEAQRTSGRSRRLGIVLASVAAVIALGALGAVGVLARHQPSTQPVVAQGSLQPLHAPRAATGSVTVLAEGTTRHMIVRTRDLAGLPSQRFYEVWLLDPATQKMLAVGVLPPSGNGAYEVTAGLMAGYSAVDVSLQPDDGNPAHSQTSVLRALL